MADENNTLSFYSKNYIKNLSLGYAAQLPFVEKTQAGSVEVEASKSDPSPTLQQEELLNLVKLRCFIQAWSDPIEAWNEIDIIDRKKIRQLTKFKKNISKSTRRSINLGLYELVFKSLQLFKQAFENAKNESNELCIKQSYEDEAKRIELLLKELEESYLDNQPNTKKKFLLKIIDDFLFKNFKLPTENEEIFLEAAKLISCFSSGTDKFFYGMSHVIALIASLACGLSTGGAIFVLLVSFSLPLGFVIPLSLLIFLSGTRANFQLFSQHIPQFFQDICKSGGLTEFIDQQGNRLQLSLTKKRLLLPAGFLSLSVGIAAAAITYLEGTKMIALMYPMLAVTCPHLTVVLLGILASALLIGLTIVMLRTFIGVLQSQFSWEKSKQSIKEKWQNLNFTKGLGYAFKAFVMFAAFFGLGYLDFTGTSTLAGLLGWVAADIVTIAAIIGDLPFTLITALAWCNSLLARNNSNSDLTKDRKYYLRRIEEFFALIINALGNAALVFTDSCVSRIASIACFMNSYASNRIQENDSKLTQARTRATQKALASLARSNGSTFFGQSNKSENLEEINESFPLRNRLTA